MTGQKQKSKEQILKGSGAILAFFIGSGFASGQEVLQFFGAYGTGRGMLGMGLSLFLLFLCIRRVLKDGGRLAYEDTSQIFSYYCGPYLGLFFKWMTPVFLFLSYSVMLSGSGALLQEYFGCQPQTGRLVMLVLSLGTVLLGLSRLTDIMGFLGPLIVALVFALGGICTWQSSGNVWRTAEDVQAAGILGTAGSWWLSAVLYTGFSAMISLPFLSGLGQQLKEDRVRSLCAGFSSGAFLAGAALLCLGMLANLEQIADKGVPAVFVAEQILPGAGLLFAAVMFAGIYTTAVPMLWTVCNKIAPKEHSLRFRAVAFGASLAAYLWGGADFSFLVGTVYPYIGYFGIAVMMCMVAKGFKMKHGKETKNASAEK